MKLELSLAIDIGTHLADGSEAVEYRVGRIDPYVDICERIILDFTGVRTANSSFINGLIAGLVEHHGERVLRVVTFKGCNSLIQVLVQAAIDLGLEKTQGRIDA